MILHFLLLIIMYSITHEGFILIVRSIGLKWCIIGCEHNADFITKPNRFVGHFLAIYFHFNVNKYRFESLCSTISYSRGGGGYSGQIFENSEEGILADNQKIVITPAMLQHYIHTYIHKYIHTYIACSYIVVVLNWLWKQQQQQAEKKKTGRRIYVKHKCDFTSER